MTKKLTLKQQKFVDEYLIDLNATQAAIRAGYSKKTAGQIGEQNLRKLEIQSAIQQALAQCQERTQLSQDEVIGDLRELRDICMGRKKMVVSVKNKDDEGRVYFEEIEVLQFDPQGANKSLELLGKHLSLFTDKVDLSLGVQDDVLEALAKIEMQARQKSQELAHKVQQRKEIGS